MSKAPSIEAAYAMGQTGGPAVESERQAFEAWMRGHCWALMATWDGATYRGEGESSTYYCPHAMEVRRLWAAWRDRAALNNAADKRGESRKASEFLLRAAEIMEERGKQYDKADGERSMGKCVAAFNAVTGRDLTEAEGWLLLQILKDVRQWQRPGFHRDSAEDCIAYAALKAEALCSSDSVTELAT